jgi:hypothetical protein
MPLKTHTAEDDPAAAVERIVQRVRSLRVKIEARQSRRSNRAVNKFLDHIGRAAERLSKVFDSVPDYRPDIQLGCKFNETLEALRQLQPKFAAPAERKLEHKH